MTTTEGSSSTSGDDVESVLAMHTLDGDAAPTVHFASPRRAARARAAKPALGEQSKARQSVQSKATQHTALWLKFLPALLVWPVWLFVISNASQEADGAWWRDVFKYWPATVAMVVGSFIAGSTPLGGGVVAFPISVLVLEFSAEESRDASVLVQAIGMTSASFLLFVTKPELLHGHIMAVSCVGGVIGMLLGLAVKASPAAVNFIYTVTVLLFGALYAYTNFVASKTSSALSPFAGEQQRTAATGAVDVLTRTPARPAAAPPVGPLGAGRLRDVVLNMALLATAVLGGFITGNVGSGSDMMLYVFGIYIWNTLCPEKRLSDNTFTASSVVVMAAMSVVTALARSLTASFSPKVMHCWGAMAIVVCVGAPIGSLVLTPAAVPYLRALFYALAVIQFAMFAALKIQDDTTEWLIIACLVAIELAALAVHYRCFLARLAARVRRAKEALDARRRADSAAETSVLFITLDTAPTKALPPASPTSSTAAAPPAASSASATPAPPASPAAAPSPTAAAPASPAASSPAPASPTVASPTVAAPPAASSSTPAVAAAVDVV